MSGNIKYKNNPTAGVSNNDEMLQKANEHIEKLNQELKFTTDEMLKAKDKVIYYKTILQKILDL